MLSKTNYYTGKDDLAKLLCSWPIQMVNLSKINQKPLYQSVFCFFVIFGFFSWIKKKTKIEYNAYAYSSVNIQDTSDFLL